MNSAVIIFSKIFSIQKRYNLFIYVCIEISLEGKSMLSDNVTFNKFVYIKVFVFINNPQTFNFSMLK